MSTCDNCGQPLETADCHALPNGTTWCDLRGIIPVGTRASAGAR